MTVPVEAMGVKLSKTKRSRSLLALFVLAVLNACVPRTSLTFRSEVLYLLSGANLEGIRMMFRLLMSVILILPASSLFASDVPLQVSQFETLCAEGFGVFYFYANEATKDWTLVHDSGLRECGASTLKIAAVETKVKLNGDPKIKDHLRNDLWKSDVHAVYRLVRGGGSSLEPSLEAVYLIVFRSPSPGATWEPHARSNPRPDTYGLYLVPTGEAKKNGLQDKILNLMPRISLGIPELVEEDSFR